VTLPLSPQSINRATLCHGGRKLWGLISRSYANASPTVEERSIREGSAGAWPRSVRSGPSMCTCNGALGAGGSLMPRLKTTPCSTPACPSQGEGARWWAFSAVVLTISIIACSAEDNTALSPGDERPLRLVIREYPNGCPVEVIETSSEDTDTVLVTFDGAVNELCAPKLAQWGIDLADPIGVDTPQGNQLLQIDRSHMANLPPSPSTAGLPNNAVRIMNPTPPQVMIEFDPPVSSVEFYYSRFFGERAYWNGMMEESDSMMVWAMSRFPGSLSYNTYASRKLYSNTPRTVPWTWTVWEPVKLTASADKIQWLWLNGAASLDLLKITRKPLTCSPSSVVRGSTVSCVVSSRYQVSKWEFFMEDGSQTSTASAVRSGDQGMVLSSVEGTPTVEWISDSRTWAGPVGVPTQTATHACSRRDSR
jgi:hypothetical protein